MGFVLYAAAATGWMLGLPFMRRVTWRAQMRGDIICRDRFKIDGLCMAASDVSWVIGAALLGLGSPFINVTCAALLLYCFEYRRWKPHRHHVEDCMYGHRRNRYAKAKRLHTWRRVAIRPVFAPT